MDQILNKDIEAALKESGTDLNTAFKEYLYTRQENPRALVGLIDSVIDYRNTFKIGIKVLDDKYMPTQSHEGEDVGYDVRLSLPVEDGADKPTPIRLKPGETRMVQTGITFTNVPVGAEVQIRSRSGLARKQGIFVLNSPGTVDPGYTGPCGVILHNTGNTIHTLYDGDRIAQLVITKTSPKSVFSTDMEKSDSARGDKGFGSSGLK